MFKLKFVFKKNIDTNKYSHTVFFPFFSEKHLDYTLSPILLPNYNLWQRTFWNENYSSAFIIRKK